MWMEIARDRVQWQNLILACWIFCVCC